jgi:hypothetical protein
MPTTVVNIAAREDFDVYIGRASPRYGLRASPYANPFKIGIDGDRHRVIEMYREWIDQGTDDRTTYIREHVHELKGKRLGCWCFPGACHGQVLAELADRSG